MIHFIVIVAIFQVSEMLHFIVIVAIFQVSEPLDAPFHSYSSHIPSF